MAAAAHFLIRKKLFNTKYPQLHVAKDFAVAEKKLHLAVSGRKYDPGKKAPKRKHTSDVKTADPKPSTSQEQQPQDEPVPEQQPQDEPIPEQQPQDKPVPEQQPQYESISEQQQATPTAEQQPQDKASDTLTSPSSDDSLPDYGTALKTFTMKDPRSVPKKLRYSLHSKTEYIYSILSYFLITDQRNMCYILKNSRIVTKCHMCQNFSDLSFTSYIPT